MTDPLAPNMPTPDLLQQMQQERGYLLSYHAIYGQHEPAFLAKYAELYRYANLSPRFLSERQRELCWVALLGAQHEPIGLLHIERGERAGLSADELTAAVALGAIADAWPTLAFAFRQWQAALQHTPEAVYQQIVAAASGPLSALEADLVLLVVQGVRRREEPFIYHLRRLLEAGLSEAQVAEAISYLQLQAGNNTLLWAGNVWLAALRDGRLPPSPSLGRGEVPTRFG
ncbi:MAG: hypothetical protein KatS3mg061_3572 [Dehalococcoidia bacterium]|nr:MAG: hypothetical protein KatS3mg061_3572 [Dehalococcoidia bacterium]